MKKNSQLHLKKLLIQNFATFSNEEIIFSNDFNVIVGETGSGKSLILDALDLIFGGRADKKSVRKNAEFASVEAVFKSNDPDIKKYFDKIGHPYEGDEIIIKRIIYPHESSKTFLNFQSCSLQTLSSFARRYVDLVGQFENQKLLSETYQLLLLDQYTGIASDVKEYKDKFSQLTQLKEEKENILQLSLEKVQREEFLRFQIEEIESLSPSKEDEQELLLKKEEYLSWQNTRKGIEEILHTLTENENFNILNALNSVMKIANNNLTINDINHDDLLTAHGLIEDYSYKLSKHLEKDYNEEELEATIDRLDRYQKIKRKYKGDIDVLIEQYQDYKNEFSKLSELDIKLADLEKQIKKLEQECLKIANELHQKRKDSAQVLSEKLTQSIQCLKMIGASIKFQVTKQDQLQSNGNTKITLTAETNPGEGYYKVKEIASGGELSRILLALRQILSSKDSISVFLFDEIDTGVGGETAFAVGSALQNVSRSSQVIAITHLPQIAKFSDQIIEIIKKVDIKDKKTVSSSKLIGKNKMNEYVMNMVNLH